MCGICGVIGNKNAGQLTFLALYALQHRGEEGAGIASYDGRRIRHHKGLGHVREVFGGKEISRLKGSLAIGHTRYSTTGSGTAENVQPLLARHRKTPVAVAHNGNLINARSLHQNLEKQGAVFHTSTDSELIVHLLARAGRKELPEQIRNALCQLDGAYSLVMMIGPYLIGARDRYGFRPLCLGRLGSGYVLCSETCALDLIGAEFVRDIDPGEAVIISDKEVNSFLIEDRPSPACCIFEYVYFARPDSRLWSENVYNVRKQMGRILAREHPVKSDLVMPLPDSGSYAALGFSAEADIPYEMGMIRNHYVGRTFIQPSPRIRNFGVRVKLNPLREVVRNKKITVIDDSIVRGTTSKSRISLLRECGAKEIHMRVSSPPIVSPCFYGIDFPTRKELIAARKSVGDISSFIGLDSLGYLSLKGLLSAVPQKGRGFCTACFSGEYPTRVPKRISKTMLGRS